jgi:FkbM family methyltransferase
LVGIWLLAYGKFRLRGTGLLIRLLYPIVPGLKSYPLDVPGLGTVRLDFAEGMAYSLLLRFKLHDMGTDVGLYRAIENFLQPGGVLWDVGAFAGYVSAHFADPKFQLASIETFEPNPASLAHLRKFFAASSLVKLRPFALGSADTTMELSVDASSASTASLVQKTSGARTFTVEVKRGDTAQQQLNLPLPDVIKIDVEGFETEVVAGLAQTIARKRPAIVFEHIFLSDEQMRKMVPAGYNLFFIADDGRIYEGMSCRGRGHDAILVPEENKEIERLQPVKAR